MSFVEALTPSKGPKHQPTQEQQTAIDAAVNTTDNLLLEAFAGAAKTTTLEYICYALPPTMPILSIAFNKRIADEMATRLPSNVKAKTINSLGHGVWSQTASGKIFLNPKKSNEVLKGLVDNIPSRKTKDHIYQFYAENLRAISRAKTSGFIPDGKFPNGRSLFTTEEFWKSVEEEEWSADVTPWIVEAAIVESIQQGYKGHIDFDDQIYLSTLFGGAFPKFPTVLCDEAQDFNLLNIRMLERLVSARVIAVGDSNQSIYRFRGAHSSSMAIIKERFNMRSLTLSTSFRCPKAIVENVHWRVPTMKYAPWAKDGRVVNLKELDYEAIEDGAAIICRNNAPLIKLAFELIMNGRGVKMVGFDIGPGLIKLLERITNKNWTMTAGQVLDGINQWEEERLLHEKGTATVRDRAECLRVFCTFGSSLGEIHARATDIFKRSGPIQLLSGHKAKGLEWDFVYHLDPWRIPSPFAKSDEEITQEHNVRYVIETRAKDTLYLVNRPRIANGDGDA